MGRGVSIEEALLTRTHEELQRRSKFETGLLVGLQGAKADTLLRIVPTPAEDDAPAATLAVEWILQHAAQVAKMLPGGVVVVGVYVLAPTAKLSALEPKLLPLLDKLSKRLPADAISKAERQAVLLQLPTDSRKASCRAATPGAAKLAPVELKTSHAPAALTCFAAEWSVDVTLRLRAAGGGEGGGEPARASKQELLRQLEPAFESIRSAVATVGGALPAANATVASLAGDGGSLASPHAVKLFAAAPLPPLPVATEEDEDEDEDGDEDGDGDRGAAGSMADGPRVPSQPFVASARLSGRVHARAFASPKEEVGAALRSLRADLVRTVEARVGLLLDELEEEEEDGGGGSVPAPAGLPYDAAGAWALPMRAQVDVGGGLSLCDYVSSGEGCAECAERFSELLGVPVHEGSDLGPEEIAVPLPPPAAAPQHKAATAAGSSAEGGPASSSLALPLAVGVGLLAVAAALAAMAFGGAEPPTPEAAAPELASTMLDAAEPSAGAEAVV